MNKNNFLNSNDTLLVSSWKDCINRISKKVNIQAILDFVLEQEKQGEITCPPKQKIFSAFISCPLDSLKIVLIGQDPYHHPGQANGLSFSVPLGVKIPPSLRNIFKEIRSDIGPLPMEHGDLSSWASQGILLLNSLLTVNAHEPASHKKAGWEAFTDAVIADISLHQKNIVFLLWGKYACSKTKLIDDQKHLILQAMHPSPFSAYRGFFGCKHFSKANTYLAKYNKETIDWSIQSQSHLDFPDHRDTK